MHFCKFLSALIGGSWILRSASMVHSVYYEVSRKFYQQAGENECEQGNKKSFELKDPLKGQTTLWEQLFCTNFLWFLCLHLKSFSIYKDSFVPGTVSTTGQKRQDKSWSLHLRTRWRGAFLYPSGGPPDLAGGGPRPPAAQRKLVDLSLHSPAASCSTCPQAPSQQLKKVEVKGSSSLAF